MIRGLAIAVGLSVLGLVACVSSPGLPASAVCTEADSCAEGLSCMSFGISSPSSCTASTEKTCSKACATDADCASLKGPDGQGGFTCFHNCEDAGVAANCGKLAH